MHICHLSLFPDAFCSTLLDLTDDDTFVRGQTNSRDSRLHQLWLSYRNFCEQGGFPVLKRLAKIVLNIVLMVCSFIFERRWKVLEGVPDRASKKLFTKDTLLPGAGKFPEPSQKICSATSSRYFIFWISSVMNEFLKQFGDQATTYMLQLVMVCINIFFVWLAQLPRKKTSRHIICPAFTCSGIKPQLLERWQLWSIWVWLLTVCCLRLRVLSINGTTWYTAVLWTGLRMRTCIVVVADTTLDPNATSMGIWFSTICLWTPESLQTTWMRTTSTVQKP